MRRHSKQKKKQTEHKWKNEVDRQKFKYNLLGIVTIMIIIALYCSAKGYL